MVLFDEKRKRIFITVVAIIAAAAVAVILCACSQSVGISFVTDKLELCVGDTRDLLPYAVFDPATADDKVFSLSSDGDCIETDGTSVRAVRPGTATVTAYSSGGAAEIQITVAYRAAANLTLICSGDTVQTVESGKSAETVSFTARLDDNIDPNTEVVWSVNGQNAHTGRTFDFEPDGYGEFTVSVTAQGLYDEQTVKIYHSTEAEGAVDGELMQSRDFSPVYFYAEENIDARNPRSEYLWTVNGDGRSSEPTFTFVPHSMGSYEVELYINNVKRKIDGKDSIVVTANGGRAPVGSVRFDDCGGVYIVWRDGAAARSVTITDPGGTRNTYSSFDARYSYRFEPGRFNADGLIDVCSDKSGEYVIAVTGDEQGEAASFLQYPADAAQYIDNDVLCHNSFISDAAQAADWIRELYAAGIANKTGYLSREVSAGGTAAESVLAAARAESDRLGMAGSIEIAGSYIYVRFEPFVNVPSECAEPIGDQVYMSPLHIEDHDGGSHRPTKYSFPIELAERTVKAENSEQLLLVVSDGCRPEFADGSAVGNLYSRIKSALISIIGAKYNERQKVHAIYDWLQFCTLHAESARRESSADYIEGVFGNSSLAPGAVSSLGMAKTFAVMCGIEGIDCEISSMRAGSEYYYWNKVRVDGMWYNVDVYGSELTVSGNNECTSHGRLFISDREAAELGLVPTGEPAYDDGGAAWLDKSIYDGQYFDYHIAVGEVNDSDALNAAIGMAFEANERSSVTVWTPRGKYTQAIVVYAAEFMLDGALSSEDVKAISENIMASVVSYFKDKGVSIANNAVHIAVSGNVLQVYANKKQSN